MHRAKVNGLSNIQVWGDGLARREFTYVDDISSWLVNNLEYMPAWPDLMNLGLGKDYSVNEFYQVAMKVVDHQLDLVHDLEKPTGMKQKLMDSSLATETCRWRPTIDIEVGMKNTYIDFLERGI